MLQIGFIGGGKMAQALAKGFVAAGLSKGEAIMASCHPADEQSATAFKAMGAVSTHDNAAVARHGADVVIVAVKPSVVDGAMREAAAGLRDAADASRLFLSIAMGVPLRALEGALPQSARVIRAMPNTPALVRSAASVFSCGARASADDSRLTRRLLEAVGTCEEVPEALLDPITALSGSGPAYVYVMIEALADGGVKMGLPRDMAYRLAAQTVLGAGRMVRDTMTHPGVLKDDVSSPAGSTTAGLHFLEQKGFRAAVIGAVEVAANRCREVSLAQQQHNLSSRQ